MDAIDPDCLVGDYEAYLPTSCLPDKDDRHVLAAAIQARVSVIVTYNVKDFPREALAPHGGRALHPDAFLVALLWGDSPRCVRGMQSHRASLRNPPKSEDEYLTTLRELRLRSAARHLEEYGEAV